MENIWKNSLLILIFLVLFLFKDSLYNLLDKKEYNFDFIKENELEYYKTEYEKLSGIKNDNNYLISKIIFRNVYDFYNEITITKGKNYNIKKGDIVVSEDSLVGIISEVNKTSSNVYLLKNPNVQISVKINDTYGILKSIDNKLYVKNIVSEAKINEGDLIYTSGLTNILPNILIGKVKKVEVSEDKLEKILEIEENVDLKDLDYVMIINNKESD